MDHAALLEAVRARAEDPQTRTDMGAALPIAPTLSARDLATTVERLHFRPPGLFLDLMQQIGNGGFGPGYGFIGLEGGEVNEQEQTAVDFYCWSCAPNPDDPVWHWPEFLLPFCSWGCAIYTCLDCSDQEMRLHHWDPNVWEPGVDPKVGLADMGDTLPGWLQAWVDGVNLWDRIYGRETLS